MKFVNFSMLNFIKKIKKEKGAAAVEFAFLLIFILVPIVFGIIYFGPIYTDHIAVNQAARYGARLLAVESFSDSEIQTVIYDSLPSYVKDPLVWGHLDIDINDVIITHLHPDNIGAEASVKVSGDYVINIPLIEALSNKTITISNEVFMRQER